MLKNQRKREFNIFQKKDRMYSGKLIFQLNCNSSLLFALQDYGDREMLIVLESKNINKIEKIITKLQK